MLIAAVGLFFLFPQTRNRPLSLVEAPFVWTASQLTRTVRGATDQVRGAWSDYAALKGVRKDLKRVEGERDRLLVALSQSWEEGARADHLARLLELKKRLDRPSVAARVLGTDASHWFRALLVDRGAFDGVVAGDGVLVPEGVVGRVAKVTHTTAQVLSVHNRASVIPARVQRSRHAGVLVGGVRPSALEDLADLGGEPLPPPEVLMELKYVQRNADVVAGDTVVTSGLEGRFPPGVPVGKVVRVVRSNSETFLKVYVVPVLPFGAVEEVLVLTGEERPVEEPWRPGLWLLAIFGLFFAVPLQVGLLPQVLPGPWTPHLGLLAVFLAGFLYGEVPGVALGLLLGNLYDRFTVGNLGLHLLLLPLVGAGAAVVRRLVPELDLVGRIVVLAVTVAASEVISAVLFDLAGQILLDGTLVLRQLIPAVLTNVAFGALLLLAVGRPEPGAAPVIPVEREAMAWVLRRRLTWTLFVMLGVFALFLLRSWFLQVFLHDKYLALAQSNRIRTVVEKPERGLVFDRYGRPLVDNAPSFDLALVLDDVADLPATVAQVADLLGLAPEPIRDAAQSRRSAIPYLPVTVRKNLTLKQVADVEWAHIPGVVVLAETDRHHLYGRMAVHLLGYVGEITERQLSDPAYAGVLPGTRVGQYGVERSFDRQLRGVPGRRRIEVDAKGFEVREQGREPPIPGSDLYLTIDLDVQRAAEQALGDRNGAVVALDPRSGEVLALVSRPAFDAEAVSRGITADDWRRITADPGRPLVNRVIQGAYPPGSVFKVPVAVAIMETLPQPYTFFCTGEHPFMGRTYRDWKVQGHGRIDLFSAIVESCDVFFYEYGERLGIDTIADYASRFGIGAVTGIDLGGENAGTLPSTRWKEQTKGEIWYPGETLSAAIGQGYVTVTPLQVADLMAAVASGGKRFVPSVRLGMWDHAGDRFIPDLPRALPPAAVAEGTLRTLQAALKAVVASPRGTGTAARSRVTTIAGKTGTAQVAALADDILKRPDLEDVPHELRDHAWFTAYAPTDDPRIAVAVLVEHGGHGGGVAAPVARQVIEAFMAAEKARPGGGTLAEYLASLRTEG